VQQVGRPPGLIDQPFALRAAYLAPHTVGMKLPVEFGTIGAQIKRVIAELGIEGISRINIIFRFRMTRPQLNVLPACRATLCSQIPE
jgi:hypothetical protein